ncbi:antitoxin Xre/MbcA/ParS toxin-binding domain-containing protein [Paraburkholderia sp. BR10954]|uniref:antitoxin Xre/MbcA/ParS toxin-binding domain-containing protein n=1 Tax=Paraburkholderia sp. BR10954 TaxID=3236995 RepID=UPI0034D2D5D7
MMFATYDTQEAPMATKGWSPDDSARLVRLARVLARAAEVFDDLDLALAWLKTPVIALEHATPLSLVDTDVGTESVMDALGRIEHGVFA